MAFNFGGAMLDTMWMEETGEGSLLHHSKTLMINSAPYDVDVLTEP